MLKKRKEELEGKKGKAKGAIEADLAPETNADKIQAEMDRVQGALNDLINPANQVILAAQTIGDAFAESFRGLITGSMSAQEALANLFQRTADHFADMAAQMIAKQIQMKILGIALSFFNPAASQGGSFAGVPNSTLDSVLPSTSSLADAAVSTPLRLNAAGSYISSPTAALVGEGGQGEYVILKARCVKAWRVTRVVLAVLLSSQKQVALERQAKVVELRLPHQSTFATPWNVSTALIM